MIDHHSSCTQLIVYILRKSVLKFCMSKIIFNDNNNNNNIFVNVARSLFLIVITGTIIIFIAIIIKIIFIYFSRKFLKKLNMYNRKLSFQ